MEQNKNAGLRRKQVKNLIAHLLFWKKTKKAKKTDENDVKEVEPSDPVLATIMSSDDYKHIVDIVLSRSTAADQGPDPATVSGSEEKIDTAAKEDTVESDKPAEQHDDEAVVEDKQIAIEQKPAIQDSSRSLEAGVTDIEGANKTLEAKPRENTAVVDAERSVAEASPKAAEESPSSPAEKPSDEQPLESAAEPDTTEDKVDDEADVKKNEAGDEAPPNFCLVGSMCSKKEPTIDTVEVETVLSGNTSLLSDSMAGSTFAGSVVELVKYMSHKEGKERGFEVLLDDFKEFLFCSVLKEEQEQEKMREVAALSQEDLTEFLSCSVLREGEQPNAKELEAAREDDASVAREDHDDREEETQDVVAKGIVPIGSQASTTTSVKSAKSKRTSQADDFMPKDSKTSGASQRPEPVENESDEQHKNNTSTIISKKNSRLSIKKSNSDASKEISKAGSSKSASSKISREGSRLSIKASKSGLQEDHTSIKSIKKTGSRLSIRKSSSVVSKSNKSISKTDSKISTSSKISRKGSDLSTQRSVSKSSAEVTAISPSPSTMSKRSHVSAKQAEEKEEKPQITKSTSRSSVKSGIPRKGSRLSMESSEACTEKSIEIANFKPSAVKTHTRQNSLNNGFQVDGKEAEPEVTKAPESSLPPLPPSSLSGRRTASIEQRQPTRSDIVKSASKDSIRHSHSNVSCNSKRSQKLPATEEVPTVPLKMKRRIRSDTPARSSTTAGSTPVVTRVTSE